MMVVVIMGVVMVSGFRNEEASTGQTAADRSFRLEEYFFGKLEGGNGFLEKRERDSEIQQGGAEHIAADAGGTIEMEMGGGHDRG